MPIILYNGGVAKGYNVKVGKIGKVDKMGKMGGMGKIAWIGSMYQPIQADEVWDSLSQPNPVASENF